MKILVTGANGYIGSKVTSYLCELGLDVVAVDIDDKYIDKRAKVIKANIFNDCENWYDFFEKPDVCLHMAWRDGFVHNSKKHLLDLERHYSFLTNLIDNGLPHLACMGTMHEVGYWEGSINEKTPCNPHSLYGITKNALRQIIENYVVGKKCCFQWLRAFYIVSDDLIGNNIFCKMKQAVLNGEKTFPFTSGTNKFDFISIDELVKQITFSIRQDKINGIINCCSGTPRSLGEVMEEFISRNRLPIKLEYGKFPNRPFESPCIYGDNTKIKEIMKGVL